jgi:hypothetical protein
VAAAQSGIAAAISAGCDAARKLDIFVANAVEHDPVLFAAWRRDRRVVEGKRTAATPKAPAAPPASVTAERAPSEQPAAVPSTAGEAPASPLELSIVPVDPLRRVS